MTGASAEALFADYAAYHATRGNKICHRIGIPLIVFSVFGLLHAVPLRIDTGTPVPLDLGLVLLAAAEIYYLVLGPRFAIAMFIAAGTAYVLSAFVANVWIHVAIFVAGWILQFIGHGVYEHRQPAFTRNLTHLLVGPLWILNDVVRLTARTPHDETAR